MAANKAEHFGAQNVIVIAFNEFYFKAVGFFCYLLGAFVAHSFRLERHEPFHHQTRLRKGHIAHLIVQARFRFEEIIKFFVERTTVHSLVQQVYIDTYVTVFNNYRHYARVFKE